MRYGFIIIIFSLLKCSSPKTIFDYERKVTLSQEMGSIDISFTNKKDNTQLSGTLIYPSEVYSTILMIVPGSGKDTRHSHFILAQEFLKNNIAVFRFDERGIGRSKGKYNYTASSLIEDVFYAFENLKHRAELSDKKIGILGHSLGGIASIGALGKGCDIDFLVQMATPVQNKGAFIKYQALTNTDGFYTVKNKTTDQVINFIDGLTQIVKADEDFESNKKRAEELMNDMDFKAGSHIVNPLIIDLIKQDHQSTYQNSRIPILYIIGTEDRIVSCTNEKEIIKRLENPNLQFVSIENVNHWLSDKLAPTKMDSSLYNMNKEALIEIVQWVKEK